MVSTPIVTPVKAGAPRLTYWAGACMCWLTVIAVLHMSG
jgi:hypothetical protein